MNGSAFKRSFISAHDASLSIYDPLSEGTPASWPPLASLADQLAVQAEHGQAYSPEIKAAINHSVQRVLAEVALSKKTFNAQQGAKGPEELLKTLKDVVGAATEPVRARPQSAIMPGGPPALAPVAEIRLRPRRVMRAEILPDGQRVERYDSGAEVYKDALGRVIEAYSPARECVSFSYDSAGNLDYFVRTDGTGQVHSEGRRDKHGVIVRDGEGRVRAAGESMTVDPVGCLCIHNQEGQFVSLDLIRGLHIERRCLNDSDGPCSSLTAVFAHDGFRMATSFHMQAGIGEGRAPRAVPDGQDQVRFYGRDGSLVEFASEDELRALRPVRVLSPGSLHVDKGWRGRHQAGTAWEAVQEYLSIIT